MTDLLRGIDVSRFQGTIDWTMVPERFAFAMIGVTDWPSGNVDWHADENVQGCLLRGVIPGGYQRVNYGRNTAEREAALCVSRLAELDLLGIGRMVPALDIEPISSDPPPVDMAPWVRDLFAAWMDLTAGQRVLWYTSGSFYDSKYGGLSGIPDGVLLWPAHWSGKYSTPPNPNGDEALAEQWAGQTKYKGNTEHPALIHQYWNRGTVPGIGTLDKPIPVDLDCLMPGVKLTDVMQ